MNIVFNELSINHLAKDKDTAKEWMNNFFHTRNLLSKRLHKEVYIDSVVKIGSIILFEQFTIGEWIATLSDREYLRKIVSILSRNPLKVSYPYYYHKDNSCSGLGICATEFLTSISYPQDCWESVLEINVEKFDEQEQVIKTTSSVKNIANENHIEIHFPKRIFEHHKKHDLHRFNLNDGESTLQYNVHKEHNAIQALLDCSHGEKNISGERLYNFDSFKKRYLEFNCHLDNRYHGYHIEDENRVPESVKKKIRQFN